MNGFWLHMLRAILCSLRSPYLMKGRVELRSLSLAATLLLLCTTQVSAQSDEKTNGLEGWLKQDTATGNWDGVRTDAQNLGITPALNYTTDLLGNPVGGLKQSKAYAAGLTGSITFDMEKLLGVPDLTLVAAGSVQQGRDLSGEDIGNIFAVAQIFNGDVARLNQLYLELALWDDLVDVAVGRLAAGDDFAAADSYGYYVSGAVNGNPTSILVDFPSFTTPPFTQWGARAILEAKNGFYLAGGIYNADPSVQDDSQHGVDFTLNPGDGVLVLAEVGYKVNQGDKAKGLPGRYSLLGIHDTSDFPRLDDPDVEEAGNYGLAAIVEQMVYKEGGPGSTQGLTAWATVSLSPQEEINTLPLGVFGGAYYQGLIPNRDDDVTAIALYYGLFSDDLPGQDFELVLELNYRLQLTPWLYVTPDFQYIFNPNGEDIPNAAVFGTEISVDF